MTKHLTLDEREARAEKEAAALPTRKPKKPKLIAQDKAASKHWTRILRDMEGFELLDVLDSDALAIYCAKLARRDDLQSRYLQLKDRCDDNLDNANLRFMVNISAELQSVERDLLTYAGKLGLTPESRARLAKRMAEQEPPDPDDDLFA